MLVMGLDIATTTGMAWVWPNRPTMKWKCLALTSEGSNGEEKADDLAMFLYERVKADQPSFVAIELPQRSVTRFKKKGRPTLVKPDGEDETTINPNALQLSTLAGAAVAVLSVLDVPWGLIAPASWRSVYFSKGTKAASRDEWKALAVDVAKMQGISLPPTKKAAADAAEAVGIAVAWQRCGFVPERHREAFVALRTGRAAA